MTIQYLQGFRKIIYHFFEKCGRQEENFAFLILFISGFIEKLKEVLKSAFSTLVFSKTAPEKSQYSKIDSAKLQSVKSASPVFRTGTPNLKTEQTC